MPTETPCLSGCLCKCGEQNNDLHRCGWYAFNAALHAPNCPNAKPAEPPACEMCGQRQRLTNRPICAECDVLYAAQVAEHLEKGRWFPLAAPPMQSSEPRIEHRDVCHISYPCEDCGRIRSKAEGGTVFTICDDCWDRRSEPPIDWRRAAQWAKQPVDPDPDVSWTPEALRNMARAYLALKAERDALKATIQTRDEMMDGMANTNAALKARVEDLENLVLDIDDGQEAATIYARTIRARKEQEAGNGK